MSYLGYPDFFESYIKKVEGTRPARVEKRKKGEEFPFMSLEERQDILKEGDKDRPQQGLSDSSRVR